MSENLKFSESQVLSSNDTLENESLRLALQENFNHARHQENQRERYLTLYWLLWGAIIYFMAEKGTLIPKCGVLEYAYVFGFLSVLSFIALIVNLKWNAEFANHIATAAAIAIKLNLNKKISIEEGISKKLLPYSEFSGYLSLPMKFPVGLNVSAWLSAVLCGGVGISAGLSVFHLSSLSLTSLIIGIVFFLVGLGISFKMYSLMKKNLKTRIPQFL